MKKLFWCLIGVPVLIGLVSPAIAQPGGSRRGGGMRGGGHHGFTFWRVEKIVEKLAITPDQIRQLEDIEYKFQMESIDLEARRNKARLEMDHLLSQDTYSDRKITGLVDEIAAGSSEKIKLGLNKQIAIRGILTPEQWSQLEQRRESRSRKMRMTGKRRGGEGRGMGRSIPEENEDQ